MKLGSNKLHRCLLNGLHLKLHKPTLSDTSFEFYRNVMFEKCLWNTKPLRCKLFQPLFSSIFILWTSKTTDLSITCLGDLISTMHSLQAIRIKTLSVSIVLIDLLMQASQLTPLQISCSMSYS